MKYLVLLMSLFFTSFVSAQAILPPLSPMPLMDVPKPLAFTNQASALDESPEVEISFQEYKKAKKDLYQKMRASESIFRRTGIWIDFSYMAFVPNLMYYFYGEEFNISFGRVVKGFMFGFSYQYNMSAYYPAYLPSLHEGAFVFGYRIAPDKGIGLRLMLHTGFGGSIEGVSSGWAGDMPPLTYLLFMPEIKVDIRLYKSLMFTFGLAYKAVVFVGDSFQYRHTLMSDYQFNSLNSLRFSFGIAISY